ncbi:hypothetical protein BFW88_22445 [Pseudomonas fluorescens]|uniref:Adhesin n=1 Tax=Pseudomonas lactucae TaxID=2813360 RepID=A0A9X1C928_9PSED|nr:CS1 type fimbrial major subunit [Pseudomonas lactucae]OPA85937.1 hypothetical protein BFW88_22445 [Pseudomonas fluorescens]MBN2979012.1 hypothetical protein [Pseudomonas lactucae]MBN2989091.1 hypothetical protein [Pseudomonas lactucae]OPB06185.1 hypothetical protein BFW92_22395 [Pseudomonas fluorescens]OPB17624.1 hypothetical protein BFW93_22415 [Pseudomonas fluorescens]
MFKKIAIAAPLAFLALNSSLAFAAGEGRASINLVATVPATTFHVQPVDPDLIAKDQVLNYNPANGDLSNLRAQFDTRHTAGRIDASLESAAVLYNGSASVPLGVTFNGVTLTVGTAKPVVTKEEASAGRRVDMVITPTKPGSGYEPGAYTGQVHMVFDAVVEA